MSKMSKAEALKERIAEVELLQKQEKDALTKHLHVIRESLKPVNLLKKAVHEVAGSPGIKTKVFGALLGLVAGYFTKKAVFGKASHPLKKMAGNLIQMGVARTVSKNTDNLRDLGNNLLSRIFRRRKKQDKAMHNGHGR